MISCWLYGKIYRQYNIHILTMICKATNITGGHHLAWLDYGFGQGKYDESINHLSDLYMISHRRVASRCTTKRRESPLETPWNTSAMAYALENSLVVSNTWSTSWGGQSCRILRDVSRWKNVGEKTSVQFISYVQIYQGKKLSFIITCMVCVVFPYSKPSHFCFIRSSCIFLPAPSPAIPAIQVIRDLINMIFLSLLVFWVVQLIPSPWIFHDSYQSIPSGNLT